MRKFLGCLLLILFLQISFAGEPDQKKAFIANNVKTVESIKFAFDKLSTDEKFNLLQAYYNSFNNCKENFCVGKSNLFTVYTNKDTMELRGYYHNIFSKEECEESL